MKKHLLLFTYLLSFQLTQSQTPVVNLQTDVLVIGGTASGISAGIQSARLGVNTLVVEETPWLGGMLTSAGVPAFDGNNAMPAGLFGEFRQHLYDYYGGANAVSTGWVSNTLFEPHIGDSIFISMARNEKYLTVKYHYQFKNVIKNGNSIISAEFYELNSGAQLIVKAKRVIDATELTDLRTIVSNASRFTMQNPVVFLSNSIANGNTANQWWTGGGSTRQTLGNLYAGIDLAWNYTMRTCRLSMNNYIDTLLVKYNHPHPKKPCLLPYKAIPITYGATTQ